MTGIKLTTEEFNKVSSLVYEHSGIKMPPTKKVLLESRLHKRLRALHIESFKEYIDHLLSKEGLEHELVHMIDVITTNKTDFFREPHHFHYLTQTILPDWLTRGKSVFKIWSAACSTGEEPYTLAIVLQEFARLNKNFNYSIFASDISTDVLKKASLAVYNVDRVSDVDLELKRRYLLKSKDSIKPTVRIVPELRNKVRFGRINFMDSSYPVDEVYDVIFCRNALIYFDRVTQLEVVRKLIDKLTPNGFLFIGHSESLLQHNLPIVQVKPTIYQRI